MWLLPALLLCWFGDVWDGRLVVDVDLRLSWEGGELSWLKLGGCVAGRADDGEDANIERGDKLLYRPVCSYSQKLTALTGKHSHGHRAGRPPAVALPTFATDFAADNLRQEHPTQCGICVQYPPARSTGVGLPGEAEQEHPSPC